MDIPRSSQINIEHVIAALADYDVDESFDCVELLAIFLILEARKGQDSEYYDFIRILPTDYSSLLENWPNSLDPLLPPYLRNDKTESARRRKMEYEKVVRLLKQKTTHVTFDEYSLAVAWVFTRYKQDKIEETSGYPAWVEMIDGDCGSMAPIFDMLNHAEEPNCDWSAEDGASIFAARDIEPGEELMISYGEHGNDQLVNSYGFTLNRADDVSLRKNLLELADSFQIAHSEEC